MNQKQKPVDAIGKTKPYGITTQSSAIAPKMPLSIPTTSMPMSQKKLLETKNLPMSSKLQSVPQNRYEDIPLPQPTNFGARLQSLLNNLIDKITAEQSISNEEDIKANTKSQRKKTEENIEKIKEQIKKLEEKSIADKIKEAFGYIGSILGIIAGFLLTITGVAAGVGAAMIIGGVVGLTMSILQSTGGMDKMMAGLAKLITESLKKNFPHLSKDEAEKGGGYAANSILAAALIAIAVITAAVSFGAASGAAASTVAQAAANFALKLGNISGAVSSVVEGGAQAASGVASYKASQLEADSIELSADVNFLKALKEQLLKHTASVTERWSAMSEQIAKLLESQLEVGAKLTSRQLA